MSNKNLQKVNELTVFEELRKNTGLVTKSTHDVPLSMVFGRGTIGNIESFGGKSLVENTMLVDKALANVGELQNIWNHSHSQWDWKHINLSYHSPYKNMRQIAAEISSKKGALNEAKWRQVKNEMKIRKIEEELQQGIEKGDIDYWREVELKIKLAELREGMAEGMSYIEGALKDVLALNDMYEQLKEKVSNFSELDFEKEETKNHLKRSIVQCLRDVRQYGSITKGEQEYVEQIGVNPMKLQMVLKAYVENEAKQEVWDTTGLYQFVDALTDELADTYKVDVVRMRLQGLQDEPSEHHSYINKIAKIKKSEDSE